MSNKPNIIFIITDQQRFDTIAALGYGHMQTPNMDRLVNEGVSLVIVSLRAFAPARASLLPVISLTPRESLKMLILGAVHGSRN